MANAGWLAVKLGRKSAKFKIEKLQCLAVNQAGNLPKYITIHKRTSNKNGFSKRVGGIEFITT